MEATEARATTLANKQLTTIDCIAQSLAVGPIFSAAALGGILAALSGGVSLFVVVLTTVGILGIGWIVSELAKRFSTENSPSFVNGVLDAVLREIRSLTAEPAAEKQPAEKQEARSREQEGERGE